MDVPVAALSQPPEVVRAAEQALLDLPELIDMARPRPHHPWSLANATSMDDIDRTQLAAQIARVSAAMRAGGAQLGELLDRVTGIELWHAVDVLVAAEFSDLDGLAQAGTASWNEQVAALMAESTELRAATTPLVSIFNPSILSAPLDDLVVQGEAATSGFPLTRSGRLKAFASTLAPFVVGSPDPKSLPFWVDQGARSQHRHLSSPSVGSHCVDSTSREACPYWIRSLEHLEGAVARARTAGDVLRDSGPVGDLGRSLRGSAVGGFDSAAWLEMSAAFTSFAEGLGANADTTSRWLDGRGMHEAISSDAATWTDESRDHSFVGLGRYLELNRRREPLRELGLHSLCAEVMLGSANLDDASRRSDAAWPSERSRKGDAAPGWKGSTVAPMTGESPATSQRTASCGTCCATPSQTNCWRSDHSAATHNLETSGRSCGS